ncbi:MAG: sigma-54 dependent transcriptional regulator [Myxococcota bacterium]
MSGSAPRKPVGNILVIDDERGIRALCRDILSRAGHHIEVAETGAAGLAKAAATRFDLVFCDINLPDIDGLSVLSQMLTREDAPTFILITAFPSVETAVMGMKQGARDYLTKPFTPDELRMVCDRALAEDELRGENLELRRELANLIGDSASMAELRTTIAKVAGADATVLISGESGTGKELVARALHYEGRRAGKPFVPVNCGALVGSLLESELFGHVKGAFSGADNDKRGLFVAASGGTIFLDEIGELPLELQPKLLRVLQDGEIKPVGGVEPTRVDVRVIAATNRELSQAVREGKFREDLFYRLHVITVAVPPLRDRRSDIPLLARHFAERAAQRTQQSRPELSPGAIDWLQRQPWPGNVRQLENAVERAVVLATGPRLEVGDFETRTATSSDDSGEAAAEAASPDQLISLAELERIHILRVLRACSGQKTKASAILGINRTTLWKKLRQYGIE